MPSLSQQHLPLPSHSCTLLALGMPESFPAAFGKWVAFRKQLQLEKKNYIEKEKGKCCEKLISKTSSSCKACRSSCSVLVVFLENVACTLRNKKTTG